MSTPNNIAEIRLSLTKGEERSVTIPITDSKLEISDAIIQHLFQDLALDDVKSCTVMLGLNNVAVSITKYSITEKVFFDAFYNIPSNISSFQSKGTSVHIIGQTISLLQLDCQSILLGDCNVKQLDIGLAEFSEALRKQSQLNDKDDETPLAYKMKTIDIRGCSVVSLKAYVECDSIKIQSSNIELLDLCGGIGNSSVKNKRVFIWQHSSVRVMEIFGEITAFTLRDSTISNLVAKANCLISNLTLENTEILNSSSFNKHNFASFDINVWRIIGKSAENSMNSSLRADAYYNIAKLSNLKEPFIHRLFGKIFDFCTGYGYKPLRVFFPSICTVLLSTLFITVKDAILYQYRGFGTLLLNLQISIAAFAGNSGLVMQQGYNYWVGTASHIIGIIIFAMFVNSLFVRYRD